MTSGRGTVEPATRQAGAFEVTFLDGAGVEQRRMLSEVSEFAFEGVAPVRSFPAFRGQRNNTGWWWAATTGRHVCYESWLERDHVIQMDFAPDVIGFASQPFWLLWNDGTRRRAHAPDYFARLADGTGLVLDCRPAGRIKPQDAAAFAATERACAEVGWRYEVAHEPDPCRMANLRRLAGYRHARCGRADLAERSLELAARPQPLMDLAIELGDPICSLPVVFHLLWGGELEADLGSPLHERTVVVAASGQDWVR